MMVNFRDKKGPKRKRQKEELEEYVEYLLLLEVRTEEDVDRVAVEMLRLPWKEDKRVEGWLTKYLLKLVKKGQFYHMNYIAALLAFL